MSVQITAKRLSGGTTLQHITNVQWVNDSTNNQGQSTTASMVDWIENKGGYAHTGQGPSSVKVDVVTPNAGPKYLRTRANNTSTDNLLALPDF